MEKRIITFENKCEAIREEIMKKNFHIKSQSGLLDKVMFDSEKVQQYLESKSQELSDFKDQLVNEFDGNRTELEKYLNERAENFLHEMAYLITVGKMEL